MSRTKRILLLLACLVFTPGYASGAETVEKTMNGLKKAVFAGGCFWCMEKPYDEAEGVVKTVSGYTGGNIANPSYEQVSSGGTGHREALEVTYDPEKIAYSDLLDIFWRNIDPFDDKGQFCDKGFQYTSAIYVNNEEEREAAEASKQAFEAKAGTPAVTPVTDAAPFYPAEDYHQDYYQKNPVRYKYYRWSCGRDKRLEEIQSGLS